LLPALLQTAINQYRLGIRQGRPERFIVDGMMVD